MARSGWLAVPVSLPTADTSPSGGSPAPGATAVERSSLPADCLLALGILLTTASQFRLGGLPIGPGELCLLVWLTLILTRELVGKDPALTPALARLTIFWAGFALSESLGLLVGLSLDFGYDAEWLMHDVLAFPLLAAVTCLSVLGPGARARQRRVCWLVVTLGALSLSVQIAAAAGVIDIPGMQPWFWERFRGWSSNPNQLALLCAVLGLLALHLADSAGRPGGRVLAIVCMVPAIIVGRLTQSDTFSLALVAAGPIYLGLKLQAVLLQRERTRFIPTAFLQIILLASPLMLVALVPLAATTALSAGSLVGELAKNGGKSVGQESDLRLTLWTQAMQLGLKSGMMGVGPGPHLEIPPSILAARRLTVDQPENLPHPEQNISAPNFEAHNSFFDLLTQGGIIAVAIFTWILFAAGRAAYTSRNLGLLTALCCLVIYCLTGLYIRHPIFWFTVTLCLVEARRPEATGAILQPEPTLAASPKGGWQPASAWKA